MTFLLVTPVLNVLWGIISAVFLGPYSHLVSSACQGTDKELGEREKNTERQKRK